MTIQKTANATLAISSAAVTFSLDQSEAALITALEALTFTEIGDVEDLSEQGDTFNELIFNSVSANRVRRIKGLRDGGTMNLVVGYNPDDSGQDALVTASKSTSGGRTGYAFRIQLDDNPDSAGDGTPTTFYFVAHVAGYRQQMGQGDNIIRRTFPLWINSDFIEVAADEGDS